MTESPSPLTMLFSRHTRRREFIAGLGSAAAWPLAAWAQQAAVPVIGYLYMGSPETVANRLAAFLRGLSESGFVEGRNLMIEYRYAHNLVAETDLSGVCGGKASGTHRDFRGSQETGVAQDCVVELVGLETATK